MYELILKGFINQPPFLQQENIINIQVNKNPSTGVTIARAKTSNGQVYIKTILPNGFSSTEFLEIPQSMSKEDRDKMIIYLSKTKKLVQLDIAYYLDISQATVSRVLKEQEM